MSAIDRVLELQKQYEDNKLLLEKFGIYGLFGLKHPLALIGRAEKNKRLADALLIVRGKEILIFVESKDFQVGINNVTVNINATDDEIVEFLLGKEKPISS